MPATVSSQIAKLNSFEWHYIATHPHHAYAITQAFKKTVAETAKKGAAI